MQNTYLQIDGIGTLILFFSGGVPWDTTDCCDLYDPTLSWYLPWYWCASGIDGNPDKQREILERSQ